MALVKCPECGRENVSDSAESCPNCGYGIKAHFERIQQEERRKEQERRAEEARKQAEIDEQMYQEQRVKSVPKLEKPQLTAPIVIFVISLFCFLIGKYGLSASSREVERSMSHGNGNPHFYGGLFIFFGIVLVICGVYLLIKRIKRYHLSKNNFEEYQKMIIREQDQAFASAQAAAAARAREEAMKPECPYCHSKNLKKITATSRAVSIGMVGVASGKIGKQWHCNNCKSDF